VLERVERETSTLQLNGWLKANYHSLQVALNKPFSRGFFIKGAYTWSKAMNRADDEGWSGVAWEEPAYQFKNYSWAGYDRTHIFQIGFVWEMPFGRDGSGVVWAPVTEVRYGNEGRLPVRGPGVMNIDAGLFRRFPIGQVPVR